jgi:hypothetical protein
MYLATDCIFGTGTSIQPAIENNITYDCEHREEFNTELLNFSP